MRSASSMAATSLDSCSASVTEIALPRAASYRIASLSSCTIRPATLICPPSVWIVSVGVVTCSSSAAEYVTSLNVDPGSYKSLTAIAQQRRIVVAKVVGVECRPNRQRQNLSGVRILHHDRPVRRPRPLHVCVQRLLRHVLDIDRKSTRLN